MVMTILTRRPVGMPLGCFYLALPSEPGKASGPATTAGWQQHRAILHECHSDAVPLDKRIHHAAAIASDDVE